MEKESLLNSLIEERQLFHLNSLDDSYIDSFSSLRIASGLDKQQLENSYVNYQIMRPHLLRMRLDKVRKARAKSNIYPQKNAFLLPECNTIESSYTVSAVVEKLPVQKHQQLSYAAWRRALLSRRFEKRRQLIEEDRIRRLAAENVQRAMEAEAAARDEFEEIKEEREKMHKVIEESKSSSSSTSRRNNETNEARDEGGYIWRLKHCLPVFEDVQDSALLQTMEALGIPTGQRLKAPPVQSSQGISRIEHAKLRIMRGRHGGPPPQMSFAMFGQDAARIGARSVTTVAFLPSDPDTFAVGTDTGAVSICSASHGLVWATMTGHEGPITGMDWAIGDGFLFLVTVSIDKTARVWLITLPTFELPPPSAVKVKEKKIKVLSRSLGPSISRLVPSAAKNKRTKDDLDPVVRAAERERIHNVILEEEAAAREEERRRKGAVAKGGDAACVQVISTDFVLTHVLFFPLSPSLFVAAGVDEEEYFLIAELQARIKNAQNAAALARLAKKAEGDAASAAATAQAEADLADDIRDDHVIQEEEGGGGDQTEGGDDLNSSSDQQLHKTGSSLSSDERKPPQTPDSGYVGYGIENSQETLDIGKSEGGGLGKKLGKQLWGKAFDEVLKKGGGALKKLGENVVKEIDSAVVKLDQAFANTKQVSGAAAQGIEAAALAAIGARPKTKIGNDPEARALAAAAAFTERLNERRSVTKGYLLVFDAVNGRILQTRLVHGVQVDPTTLAQPASYPTAMTFSLDSLALYVADARGLIHLYEVETDESRLDMAGDGSSFGANPLGGHAVLFGERSALLSGLRKVGDAVTAAAAGLEGLGSNVGQGISTINSNGNGDTDDILKLERPYFTSLFCKQDSVLEAPVLIGLDSKNRTRALTVPAAGSPLTSGLDQLGRAAGEDEVAKAALAAVGLTTKLGAFLVQTGVGVATLGALQVNLQTQSVELSGYVKYNASYKIFNSTSYTSSIANEGGFLSAMTSASGQPHTTIAPVPGCDAIAVANSSGDIYIIEPHNGSGLNRHGKSLGHGLSSNMGSRRGKAATLSLMAAAQAATGSGVTDRQVTAKLSVSQALNPAIALLPVDPSLVQTAPIYKDAPITTLNVSSQQKYLVSAMTDSGVCMVWERVHVQDDLRIM
jgi:hypothetical protein